MPISHQHTWCQCQLLFQNRSALHKVAQPPWSWLLTISVCDVRAYFVFEQHNLESFFSFQKRPFKEIFWELSFQHIEGMASRTEAGGAGGGLGRMVGRRSAKQAKSEDLWDVFLSYRVNTDQKLVQDLYWRLVGTDVVVNGKSRKMRPFWDAECLRSGESWEVGFCNAICRSTLIVAVMSRNALANVEHLKPHSASDNVILEYALALALVLWHPLHARRGLGLTLSDSCADLLSIYWATRGLLFWILSNHVHTPLAPLACWRLVIRLQLYVPFQCATRPRIDCFNPLTSHAHKPLTPLAYLGKGGRLTLSDFLCLKCYFFSSCCVTGKNEGNRYFSFICWRSFKPRWRANLLALLQVQVSLMMFWLLLDLE